MTNPTPRICVFDVNETLLDLRSLDPHFERVFGDSSIRKLWFAQLLQSAFVSTIVNDYHDFGTTGSTALDMLAARRGVALSDSDRTTILEAMKHMPPHPDVRDGLERLRSAGMRLVTLTNSTHEVQGAQMLNAGLKDYFEQMFSADTVRRLKPAPEAYHSVAKSLGIRPSQIILIAAHSWDIRVRCTRDVLQPL